MTVSTGTKPKTQQVSADQFAQILTATNSTLNQGEELAKGFRVATKNRKFFEKDLMKNIRAKYHTLDEFYTWTDRECISSKKDETPLPNGKVVRPFFHLKKEYVLVLLNLIFDRRGYHHNTEIMIKVGIDGGGKFEISTFDVTELS